MVGEIFEDIGVEAKNAELMRAHHSRQKVHDQYFVGQREPFVVTVQHVVQLLAERLRIIEKLKRREVGRCWEALLFPLLLWVRNATSFPRSSATHLLRSDQLLSQFPLSTSGFLVNLMAMLDALDTDFLKM